METIKDGQKNTGDESVTVEKISNYLKKIKGQKNQEESESSNDCSE
jgi:hypothetical protein